MTAVESLPPLEARKVLLGAEPRLAERRGATWLVSPYWVVRADPGQLTPRQVERVTNRPQWGNRTPNELLRALIGKYAGPRMTAQRAHVYGRPVFVQSAGWPAWRAAFTTPSRDHIVADAEFVAAIEAWHPGRWETPRQHSGKPAAPLVRLDQRGRLAAVLLPVLLNPSWHGASGA